jgi:hypothetical protein
MVSFGERQGAAVKTKPRDTGREMGRTSYISLNGNRYTWGDVEDMETSKLADFIKELDATIESIGSSVEGLQGDQQVRAKDKMRHCRRWSARIMEELIEEEEQCRCDELEEELKRRSEQVRLLVSAVNKHLSDQLAEIVLADAGVAAT